MIRTGLMELLKDSDKYKGLNIGLIINHTSVTDDMQMSIDAMLAKGLNVTTIFSPEHGLRGQVKEGEHIGHQTDERSGLPVYSLYGKNKTPEEEWLEKVDLLLFDIQDLGVRFYTYIYTLANTMKLAGKLGKKYIVCDRPNPISGNRIEGNPLDLHFSSFIGNYQLPIRHGMTAGELAGYLNIGFGFKADLTVIPMKNWERKMWFEETGLQWVPPSPNAPSIEMAQAYPGTCFFEGTNVSEGRGTTKPFEWVGAPWVDSYKWKEQLDSYDLEGVLFREIVFEPSNSKYTGETCQGVQIHVVDRDRFRPIETACAMIESLKFIHPSSFEWIQLKDKRYMIDLILGTDKFRTNLEEKRPILEWLHLQESSLDDFAEKRDKYLLYP
ncbi:exo-beta-N-acetylmuramidase NamZ domain-containing protein [Pseudalkalibacillus sp. A8]|uniref:exo-beta-N-acetylmuramidase NamZ family protein n=1 Tax=Pseudalkalibacillus sp. A8 TaxID=3382641 RepID=UPI0038B50504